MLAQKWGRIVNVASTAGLQGYAYVSAYCAAKHGVVGLTRSLALEVAKKGITVNAVCPGYTETDLVRDALDNIMKKTGMTLDEARAKLAESNPQGRLVQPEEVADAVAWLCQPGAGAVNGQSIPVDGGEVMVG
jgi:NAD(P)-dependent dehydrogenase (short-subunit alcohol dehydrogenase family)